MNPLEPETPQQTPQNPATTPASDVWQQPTAPQTPLQPAQNIPASQPLPLAPEPVISNAPNYQDPTVNQAAPAPPATNQLDNIPASTGVSPVTFASMTPEPPTPPPSRRKKLLLFGSAFAVLIGAGLTSYLIISRGTEANSSTTLEQSGQSVTAITDDVLSSLDDAKSTSDTSTSETKTSETKPNSDSTAPTTNNESTKQSASSSQSTNNTESSKPSPATTKAAVVSCSKDTISQKTVSSSILQQTSASVNAAVAGKSSSLTSWLPNQYRYSDKESQASAVDASYKGLQPVSCTAFPVVIRKKNSFSQQGATLIIRFKDNKNKKSYVSSINVSLVGSQWKTDRITIAKTN